MNQLNLSQALGGLRIANPDEDNNVADEAVIWHGQYDDNTAINQHTTSSTSASTSSSNPAASPADAATNTTSMITTPDNTPAQPTYGPPSHSVQQEHVYAALPSGPDDPDQAITTVIATAPVTDTATATASSSSSSSSGGGMIQSQTNHAPYAEATTAVVPNAGQLSYPPYQPHTDLSRPDLRSHHRQTTHFQSSYPYPNPVGNVCSDSTPQLRRAHSDRLGPSHFALGPGNGAGWSSASTLANPASPYNGLSRSDSTVDAAYAASSSSREPRHRLNMHMQAPHHPSSAALPPGKRTRGVAREYASDRPANRQEPLLQSSAEWQERGAAVATRRHVDANGQTVTQTFRKGVNDFSFGHTLGEGSYSTVFAATDLNTHREYAIKMLDKRHIIREKKVKYVNIEKNTLNRLTRHPGIVRLYYTFQDEHSLYFVLDLCSGGELLGALKKIGSFDEQCTRFYCAQILDAVEYMHSCGILHRDLKPENLLLDGNMHIKVTDFGTAKMLDGTDVGSSGGTVVVGGGDDDNDRSASFVGTAEYVSPELLQNKTASKATDVWAFGCILYQLLVGRPPFKAGSEYLTFEKIVHLDYQFPDYFPPAARDLVERCLVIDPAQRITIEHIKNHQFFQGQSFGKALWTRPAPRLRPYVPPHGGLSIGKQGSAHLITGHAPPTQLDIEWQSVLTRTNERILKLGNLLVTSTPLPPSPRNKGSVEHGDAHKKLVRFFGGSTTKKRERLVIVTSGGRILLAPSGGEEKRSKHEIPLVTHDCKWRTSVDPKGYAVWCVDVVSFRPLFFVLLPFPTPPFFSLIFSVFLPLSFW